MRVTFPRISAYNIGEFIFMYEFSTAVMGGLLQVDPYDQPGVELGKKVTYALMGREGYEDLAAEVMKKIQVKNRVIM
jgi:glucose-6-phosphate isomerase